MSRPAAVFFALMLALLVAPEALAQFQGGGFPGGGFPGGGMRGGMRGGGERMRGEQRSQPAVQRNIVDDTDDRLGMLAEDLQLTDAQMPAWQRYADRVKAYAADIARERSRTGVEPRQDVLQQIDHAVDIERDRLTALEDIASAAHVIYGELTPRQQSVADPRLAAIVTLLNGPQRPWAGGDRRPYGEGRN